MWINAAVRNHFARTVKDNFDKYFLIDSNPRNGEFNCHIILTS
jgi:hypothetical protein